MRESDIAFRVQENINLMILQNSEYELVIKITYDMFAFCVFVPIFIHHTRVTSSNMHNVPHLLTWYSFVSSFDEEFYV